MSASAGRVLIMPKGNYDSSVTYNMLDMVYYGGKSYICKQTSTGNVPTNTVYWQIMLEGASTFEGLTDVDINNVQDGDGVAYNATTHKWENTSPVSIAITTPPAKVDYISGEILDLTGMVVTAYYTGGSTRNVTSQCTTLPANGATLSSSNNSVAVYWRTFNATQAITVIEPIYGVEWDGSSSSAFTRTDLASDFVDPVVQMNNGSGGFTTGSSPFDSIMPWSGMELVTDENAGTLVKIPKFYYKLTINDSTGALKLQISPYNTEGFSVSPAHMDRGDGEGERDFVYVGAYHCASTTMKSTTNSTCWTNLVRSTARSYIHALGSDIWQWDKAMLTTIQMLYLVEFADWNSQSKIGYGCSDVGVARNTGRLDNYPYHTATDATSLTSYGFTKYRHIEGLWDNVYDWLDGVYLDSNGKAYFILNPADFSDTTGGTYDGFSTSLSGDEIKKVKKSSVTGFEWVVWPVELTSNNNCDTYICDNANAGPTEASIYVGGDATKFQYGGLFYQGSKDSAGKGANIGSRLMKLPANS